MHKGMSTVIIVIIAAFVLGIATISMQSLEFKVEKGQIKKESEKTQPTPTPTPTPPPAPTPSPSPSPARAPTPTPTPPPAPVDLTYDGYPTASGSLKPSNPSVGQSFNLTVSSTDDKGMKKLSWQSSKPFSNFVESGSFDCNSQLSCSNTWTLVAEFEGSHQLAVVATDSSGKEGKLTLEANVLPASTVKSTTPPAPTPTPTPAPPPVQNDECSSSSDCGYKERCQSGKCVSVECTTDSQCSGCRRCSNYNCVSCGYGPYGCYC